MATISGTSGNDTLAGTSGADSISGLGGNDTLSGGAGADTMDGGANTDTLTYAGATVAVTVGFTGANNGTGSGGDAAGDVFTTIEILQGSAFADTLTGYANSHTLQGGAGNDLYILNGPASAAVIVETAGQGTDTVNTTLGSLVLAAEIENLAYTGAGNFTATGNALANVITGGGGADVLRGGAGADTLNGGLGTDLAGYAGSAAGVSANLTTGVGTADAAGDVYNSIEGLEGSGFADTLTGDAAANSLVGGSGNDVLEGRAGADTIDGGANTDTLSYANAAAAVTAGFTGANNGTGSGGDAAGDVFTTIEVLRGSAFADTLTGISNGHTLQGGAGNDLYILTGVAPIVETAGQGVDTVQTTLGSILLAAEVENLTYTGAGNFTATGNALANVITGGGGADVLRGGAGADTLNGGMGTDIAGYAGSAAPVSANLTTAVGTGDAAGDVYSSIEGLEGSGFNDTLTGDAGGNSLSGGVGNDVLEGRAGADTIDGGTGTADVAAYTNAAAAVTIDLTTGTHTGDAAGDTFTGIEVWRGSAFADTMTSSTSITTTFQGGAGNDLYFVDAGGDLVSENAGEGIDEVRTGVSGYTLGAEVENLTYTGSGTFTGIGNASANVMTGGIGADTFTGGAGADTLNGGGGIDTASYATASASVAASLASGGTGGDAAGDTFNSIENLVGSNFGDVLTGDANANNLNGGNSEDRLIGAGGADVLTGGAGSYDAASYDTAAAAVSVNLSTGVHTGDAAGDTFSGIEMYVGSAFADTFTGVAATTAMFMGGAGADTFNGGGKDQIWYIKSNAAVTINLATGAASGGHAAGDTFTGISGVAGSLFDDFITGDTGDNRIIGEGGNDTIYGGDGNDTIYLQYITGSYTPVFNNHDASYVDAGAGNDVISQQAADTGSTILGGAGNDSLAIYNGVFDAGDGNDSINVFSTGASGYGGTGDDYFSLQGNLIAVDGGDGSDYYAVYTNGINTILDSGSSGTDEVSVTYASTSADIFYFYDSGTDTAYITSDDDMDDSIQDWGAVVTGWSTHHIEKISALDGSFILV